MLIIGRRRSRSDSVLWFASSDSVDPFGLPTPDNRRLGQSVRVTEIRDAQLLQYLRRQCRKALFFPDKRASSNRLPQSL